MITFVHLENHLGYRGLQSRESRCRENNRMWLQVARVRGDDLERRQRKEDGIENV